MEQLYIDNLGSIFCPYNHEISILIIFRWSLASYTVLMLLSNGMKIVELYLAVNQHVKIFIFSNPFLSTAKVQIHVLKLSAKRRWIANYNLNAKILKYMGIFTLSIPKGQIISRGLFGVFNSSKKCKIQPNSIL